MMETSLPDTVIQTQLIKWQAQHIEKEWPEAVELLLEDNTWGQEALTDKHFMIKHKK